MKHLVLDTHSSFCNCEYCHADSIIFQYDYKFYLITYPSCLDRFDHLSFKHDIFNQIAKKKGGLPTKRGVTYNELKPSNYERLIKKRQNEVIYIYFDNAGKKYHFTQSHSFSDYCKMNADYLQEIRNAKDFIEKSEFDLQAKKHYLGQLESIYFANWSDINSDCDYKIISLNDLLTKQIFNK
jgi:hypothetical protein